MSLALSVLAAACSDDPTPSPPGSAGNAGNGGTGNGGTSGTPGVAGGSSGNAGSSTTPFTTAPPLRNAVSLDNDALGRQVLTLLGSNAVGAEGSCRSCHSLGRPTLTRWSQLTQQFVKACLDTPTLSDQADVDAMYACFGSHAGDAASLAPADFGIYAAATHLPWFSFVFEHATETATDWMAEHDHFVQQVGMPRSGPLWSQSDFDLLAEWFARGLPGLFDLVPEDSGQDCTPGIAPELVSHVSQMQSLGWRAKNAEVPLLMFGCGSGQSGTDCLEDFTLAADESYGTDWDVVPGTRIVMLRDNSASPTTFWSRVSADGRFIGSGLIDENQAGFNGQIVDLEADAVISADFSYDATFFPDNSGFLVQHGGNNSTAAPGGGPTNGSADEGDVAIVCEQSILSDDPEEITGDEAECTSYASEFGLYQQLAKSLDGEDYWVIYGAYDGDNGGFRPVLDNPSAAFESQSITTLTPMINQGNGFEARPPTQVLTPLQGDPMLSPSGELMATRVKGKERIIQVDGMDIVTAEQSGYALHGVVMTSDASGTSATLTDVGSVCITGGKPVFSYDERWMIIHHYVTGADAAELGYGGADDPDFADYAELGASNVYLIDLLTGAAQRITNMQPGQYALYPHFRSDGWIYFVVRTLENDEYFVATDAALVVENGG